MKSNPGKGLEGIAAGLGTSTKELKLPVVKLLASRRIKKTGEKRGTKYFAGGGGGVGPGRPAKAKNGRRGKKNARKAKRAAKASRGGRNAKRGARKSKARVVRRKPARKSRTVAASQMTRAQVPTRTAATIAPIVETAA